MLPVEHVIRRRFDRLAYEVSIYRDDGTVEYDEDRRCVRDGYNVLLDIRVHIVVGAEAAGRTKRTRTLEFNCFSVPRSAETSLCTLK